MTILTLTLTACLFKPERPAPDREMDAETTGLEETETTPTDEGDDETTIDPDAPDCDDAGVGCDGLDDDGDGRVDEDAWIGDELVISEVMVNPEAVADELLEFFLRGVSVES